MIAKGALLYDLARRTVEPTATLPEPPLRRVTYAELYALTADVVSALLACGLKPGDRVASYASNCIVRLARRFGRVRQES